VLIILDVANALKWARVDIGRSALKRFGSPERCALIHKSHVALGVDVAPLIAVQRRFIADAAHELQCRGSSSGRVADRGVARAAYECTAPPDARV